MPSLRKYSVPSIAVAALAALTLSACGGSDDSELNELAKFAPADTPVFIEGSVQPDSEVAANIDSITDRLAGVNLGDVIKEGIGEHSGTDFEKDVKPWLGEDAAMFAQVDASSIADSTGLSSMMNEPGEPAVTSYVEGEDGFVIIVETTDSEAAQAFVDKQAEGTPGVKEGEYEGYSYKIGVDGINTMGVVDDVLLVSPQEAQFKAAIDAYKGDNLNGSKAFSDLAGHQADGALVTVYASNEPFLESMKGEDFDLASFYSALGYDFKETGSIVSLVPDENEIAIKGYSNVKSEMTSGDPSAVLETFPADTLFTAGSGDVGANINRIIEALNKEGIPGLVKPGKIDEFIKEASGQIDVKGIINSLETIAFFVNGKNEKSLGGALVATSSDISSVENSLRGISSLIGFAGDSQVKPLPGDIAGFRVRTSELPGRPVVIGVKDDRLVVGVGMKAAMAALTGEGKTLADTEAYKAADDSTPEDGLDMFGNPQQIAKLILNAGAGEVDAKQIADVVAKFSYMAAGSSDEEGTYEFNLGVQE